MFQFVLNCIYRKRAGFRNLLDRIGSKFLEQGNAVRGTYRPKSLSRFVANHRVLFGVFENLGEHWNCVLILHLSQHIRDFVFQQGTLIGESYVKDSVRLGFNTTDVYQVRERR